MTIANPSVFDALRRKGPLRLLVWPLLLLTVGIVPSTLLSIRLYKASEQAAAVGAMLNCDGCTVYYERQGWVTEPLPGEPSSARVNCDAYGCPWSIDAERSWAERLFGKHFTRRVVTVELALNKTGDAAPYLKRLPYLRTVLVLPPDLVADKEQDIAVKTLKEALPGVAVFGIEYDFNISSQIGQSQSPSWADRASCDD